MPDIRKATVEDAPIIALLGRITFNETFGHLFKDKNDLLAYHERTFSVAKIEGSLQDQENVFWIAFRDNLPIGYAKLKLNSPSEFIGSDSVCQLQKIYVLKDFLSLKVGLQLQETLLKEARERNYKTIWLSVLQGNDWAIGFYEKNDFKNIGVHHFQIGKEVFRFNAMARELL
ncbi:MAG: GNAT family N-acetyltransferase [Flavobacteriales bacterium]|nr:GNAT family N-acetyltransferase [Flavobacteriales bacterium]